MMCIWKRTVLILLVFLLSVTAVIFADRNFPSATAHSHWCPAFELRRVECIKNVSTDGRPPSLRRSFLWKRELVYRCCPGFMGPNCDKACFSCQQWAEMSGKVYHMEQFLSQIKPFRSAERFQPFNPNMVTSGKVCWTRDGRPVFTQMTSRPTNLDSQKFSTWGDIGGYGKKDNDKGMRYQNGCPRYDRRQNQDGVDNTQGDNDQQYKDFQPHDFQKPQNLRQDPPQYKEFKSALPEQQFFPSLEGNPNSKRTASKADDKADDEVLQRRLTTMERKIRELEMKLSAMGPRLSAATTMAEEISLLAMKIDQLQQIVLGTTEDMYTRKLPSESTVSISETKSSRGQPAALKRNPLDERQQKKMIEDLESHPTMHSKTRHNDTQDQTRQRKHDLLTSKSTENDRRSSSSDVMVPHPNSPSAYTKLTDNKNSSVKCRTVECVLKHSPPPPPLPDKEIIEILFSKSPELVKALELGHNEFYEEVKKILHQNSSENWRNEEKSPENPDSRNKQDSYNRDSRYKQNSHSIEHRQSINNDASSQNSEMERNQKYISNRDERDSLSIGERQGKMSYYKASPSSASGNWKKISCWQMLFFFFSFFFC